MSKIFGPAWTSSYGLVDEGDIWKNFLSDLSPMQVGAGVDALKNWSGKFPPNAPQFRKLCLENFNETQRKKNLHLQQQKFLSNKKNYKRTRRDWSVGFNNLDQLRKKLRMPDSQRQDLGAEGSKFTEDQFENDDILSSKSSPREDLGYNT